MRFALVLLCTAVFCYVCKDAVRKVPGAFYALALALSAMYAVTSYVTFPFWLQQALFWLMQKGTLATAFFVVVMYIGVFDGIETVRQRLKPVRAELSIIACILILGHIVKYLVAYLPRLGVLPASMTASIWLAIGLFALMLVLGVTSFQAVKRRMPSASWVKLQKSAYVFYGLLYVHLMWILLPPAIQGSARAVESAVAYTIVFVAYAVLRVGKAVRDRKSRSAVHADHKETAPSNE